MLVVLLEGRKLGGREGGREGGRAAIQKDGRA